MCRRFTRVAQEDYNVSEISTLFVFSRSAAKGMSECLLDYLLIFFCVVFTGFQFATRVPWILSCRAESIRLCLCEIFALFSCCICYIPGKIHYPAIKASVGKLIYRYSWWWFFIPAVQLLSCVCNCRLLACNNTPDTNHLKWKAVFLSYMTSIWVEEEGICKL